MTEIEAMQAVETALEPLRRDQRARVLEWAKSRYVDGIAGYWSLLSFAAGIEGAATQLCVEPAVLTRALANHEDLAGAEPEIRAALDKG